MTDLDECVVYVKELRTAKSLNAEKLEVKEKEIGRFITEVAESSFTAKRYSIPNTKLFVFANILYDDNMYSKETSLQDAVNITLAVSRSKKLSLSSSISVATLQAQYGSESDGVTLVLLARYGSKWFDVGIVCRKKQR